MRLQSLLLCALLCLGLPGALLAANPAQPSPAQSGPGHPSPARPTPSRQGPRVLVVHSYSPENTWTSQIAQGIRAGLKGSYAVVEEFYMDAKRHPDKESQDAAAAEALERIASFAPQVVIAVDDAAQDHLVVPHLRGRASPQVIVCGVNAPFAKYGYPATNVSGVRGRWHYRDGIALLHQIAPGAKSVAFLVEQSETGRYAMEDLRDDLRQHGTFALPLAGVERVHSFQHWKRLVRQYQNKAGALALPLYHALVDEQTGAVVPPEEVMAWTNAHNKLPTLGLVDYAKDHGLLCGVLASGEEQGHLAGRMAAEVLSTGKRAGTFPVQVNRRGVVMVNLKAAQRLGIVVPYPLIEAAAVLIK